MNNQKRFTLLAFCGHVSVDWGTKLAKMVMKIALFMNIVHIKLKCSYNIIFVLKKFKSDINSKVTYEFQKAYIIFVFRILEISRKLTL